MKKNKTTYIEALCRWFPLSLNNHTQQVNINLRYYCPQPLWHFYSKQPIHDSSPSPYYFWNTPAATYLQWLLLCTDPELSEFYNTIFQLPQRWWNYCTTSVELRYDCTHFQADAPCWNIPMHHSVEMPLAFCYLKVLSHGWGCTKREINEMSSHMVDSNVNPWPSWFPRNLAPWETVWRKKPRQHT